MKNAHEIILVGTFHLEQEEEFVNKEREVHEFVQFLSDLSPTKIAVEWEKSKEETLMKRYVDPIQRLNMDEIEQIGFRLARKLEHEKIHAVNWSGRITEKDMNKLHAAIQENHPGLVRLMSELPNCRVQSDVHIQESYKSLNERHSINQVEDIYLSFLEVEEREPIGANFLTMWMERELRITKNILNIVDEEEERILLIIGRDHLFTLTNLFEGKGWKVINPFESKKD